MEHSVGKIDLAYSWNIVYTLQAKSLSPPLEFSNFEIPNFLAIDRCENPSAARISILAFFSIDNCFFLAIL